MRLEDIINQLAGDQLLGIAIVHTKHRNMHAGITYQWRGGIRLYHQAFDLITRHEPFDSGVAELGGATLVVALRLRRDRQKAIAGFLDSLGRINPQYPYSLKYDSKARIDRTLGKLITKDGRGLNCVTFILAVFQSFQIRLVDASSWPTGRQADLEAQQQLVDLLKGKPGADWQAAQVEKGCTRVRPEELAGAAGCYVALPVQFAEAEPASLCLLKRLSKALGLPAWAVYPETN